MEDHKTDSLKIKLTITTPHPQPAPPPPRERHEEEVVEDYDEEDELEEGELREEDLEEEDQDQDLQHGQQRLRVEEAVSYDEEPSKKRICDVCQREFDNGKALGGHKRIHNKDKLTTWKKPDGSSPSPGSEARYLEENPHPCKFCSKVFPSEKSLHGHMRSHPERRYRGMNPPFNKFGYSNNEDVDDSDDSGPSLAVDLLGGLPRWKKTGKRGHMLSEKRARELGVDDSPPESSSCSSDCFEDEMAAGDLKLRRADLEDRREKIPPMHRDVDTVHLEDGTLVNLDKYDDDELYFMQGYFGISVPFTPSHLPNKPRLARFSASKRAMKEKGLSTIDKKKKRKLNKEDLEPLRGDDVAKAGAEAEAEAEVDVVNKYKCSTCGKRFATHQALGGHKSSHNKAKASHSKSHSTHPIANNPSHPFLTQAQSRTRVDQGSVLTHVGPGSNSRSGSGEINGDSANMMTKEAMVGVESTSSSLHECYICTMKFTSGQALGGHMRCHYNPSTESSPVQSSSQPERRGCGFDLNEPAQEEDVNGVVESNYNLLP